MSQQMSQLRVGTVDRVQQPEQRDVAGPELGDLVGALTSPAGKCLALGLQGPEQALAEPGDGFVATQVQGRVDEMRVNIEAAHAVAGQLGQWTMGVTVEAVTVDQHYHVQAQAGDFVLQFAFVKVWQGVELFAKTPRSLVFVAIFDVIEAKGLRQLECRIDLEVIGLEQVFEVACGRQRVVLRSVVQAAIWEHKLQAFELQRTVGQGVFVDLQRLYPPMERGTAQCRLSNWCWWNSSWYWKCWGSRNMPSDHITRLCLLI